MNTSGTRTYAKASIGLQRSCGTQGLVALAHQHTTVPSSGSRRSAWMLYIVVMHSRASRHACLHVMSCGSRGEAV